MKTSKVLKQIKADVIKKFDELGVSAHTDDVEIVCTDKDCLLDSIFNKMDEIINKKNENNTSKFTRNLAANKI